MLPQQDAGGEDENPLLERHCSLYLPEVLPTRKAEPFPLRKTLPRITGTPQVIPEPGGPALRLPATSSLFPQRPHTSSLFFRNRGHQKTELSRETGGFLVASGISVRLPEEHFTKRQVTW